MALPVLRRLLGPAVSLGALSVTHSLVAADDTRKERKRLLSVGLIADIQYFDAPDGFNFARTVRRHYRGALAMVPRACQYFNTREVDFVLQCGDIIDGQCAQNGSSEAALTAVLGQLDHCDCKKVYHLIGNHELCEFPTSLALTDAH